MKLSNSSFTAEENNVVSIKKPLQDIDINIVWQYLNHAKFQTENTNKKINEYNN